jgi:hypothetical protein
MKFIIEHWEGIVAILALLTSIVSTIISFYTFKLQRTHNIKSVKPILHIGQWDYEDRLFVTLKNVGSGIAVVKKMTVYNAKNENKTCIYDWLPSKLPDDMNYKEYWTPYTEFVVQASEVIKLIEININTSKHIQIEAREKLRRILGQLTVEVIYEDIYDHAMPIKKMQLSHFLRLDNEN